MPGNDTSATKRNPYRDWYERRTHRGNWFQFFEDWTAVMSIDEAAVAQKIVNLGKGKANGRWLLCTHRFLNNRLHLTREMQDRIIKRLVNRGFLLVKRKGVGARRHVCLMMDKIEEALDNFVAKKNRSPDCVASHNPDCAKQHNHRSKRKTTSSKKETLSGALSPPAAATAPPDDGGGVDVYDGMGLVTNQSKHPAHQKVTPAPIDRYYAAKLQEALKRRLNYRKAWNQTKWAGEFRVLRDTLDQDTDRLEAALDWYCAHAGEEYVPEAFSAGSFRGKFLAVEQQMKRRLADAPLPLSPEATQVLEKVDHLVWPKGAKVGLPNMVQRSLDNYVAFGARLRALDAQMTGGGHAFRLKVAFGTIHQRVKGEYLGGNVSTIRKWVERVHELVADWDDWSGNLKPWAWSLTHKVVQQDVESLGSRVLGNGAAGQKKWADYKREVGL